MPKSKGDSMQYETEKDIDVKWQLRCGGAVRLLRSGPREALGQAGADACVHVHWPPSVRAPPRRTCSLLLHMHGIHKRVYVNMHARLGLHADPAALSRIVGAQQLGVRTG